MKASKYLLLFGVFALLSMNVFNEPPEAFIKSKLEDKKAVIFDESIKFVDTLALFYQNRSYELAWNQKSASQLVFAIQQAGDEGLNPNDYHLKPLVKFIINPPKTDIDKAAHDILLSDAFLLYASHLFSGKVRPETVDPDWCYNTKKNKLIELLDFVLTNNKVNEIVQLTAPKHWQYQNLKKTLSKYRSLSIKEWTPISKGETLKKEMNNERILVVREHLIDLGDLAKSDTSKATLYDNNLLLAIEKFQARHGLEIDGKIGPATLNMLNVTIAERIDQIVANLERMRWMPRDLGEYYIQVNIANFELELVKNNVLERTLKVIVGSPTRRTPLFSSKMETIVFNPTWTVPPGILLKDVMPGIKKNPNYLEERNFTVFDTKGNVVNPKGVNWDSKEAKTYIFRQTSGPTNSLGVVKFLFPNDLFIYIHDTPHKELFNRSERAFSSGCVRVNYPLQFAEYLLNDSINWNMTKINEIIETETTKFVQLKEKPNVHLFYFTAWTDSSNVVQFRKDIYQLDNILIRELSK